MWISRRADAAVRAATELAVLPEAASVSARALAAQARLPAPFLAQVLTMLRRGGIIASVPGRRGGYRLARPADRITVGDILRAAGSPMAPIACAEVDGGEACGERESCRLRRVWQGVAVASGAVVDGVTLRDLVTS